SYRGARFEHAAAPCMPVVGTVRDVETGLPIAGIKVRGDVESVDSQADHPGASATTDDRGGYVLTGLPPGRKIRLLASSTGGLPYVGRDMPVTAKAAAGESTRCDIGLRKGVLIHGRVTDQATGRPVTGSVAYFPFPDNPRLKEYPAGGHQGGAGDDGRFEVADPPVRGVLVAHAWDRGDVPSAGAHNIKGVAGIPDPMRQPHDGAPASPAVVV